MFECPICEGEGGWTEYIGLEMGEGGPYTPCGACGKTGRVGLWWRLENWFWNIVPVRFIEWFADRYYAEEETENEQYRFKGN